MYLYDDLLRFLGSIILFSEIVVPGIVKFSLVNFDRIPENKSMFYHPFSKSMDSELF